MRRSAASQSGGRFVGAVIGKTVTFNGNTELIFDEAVNDVKRPNYGVAQWKELQSAEERAVYAAALSHRS